MFEGLHQGRILCSAIADDTTLLTGGESTVSPLLTGACECVCVLMGEKIKSWLPGF